MLPPSRYRSHAVALPTDPQSSTLCHPAPGLTPELIWAPAKSERITRAPLVLRKTFVIGPPVAVRRRNRSTLLPPSVVVFTSELTHAALQVCGRSFVADAGPTPSARAL